MKDELDTIKQLLRHTPELKAEQSAKQAAISLALSKFDKNNLNVSQGTAKPARLNVTAKAVGQLIFGRTPMKTYQLAMIGTFCALFVVWAVVPMQSLTNLQDFEQAKTGVTPSEDQTVKQNSVNEIKDRDTEVKEVIATKTEETLAKPLEAEKADMPVEAKPVAPAVSEPDINAVISRDMGMTALSLEPTERSATGGNRALRSIDFSKRSGFSDKRKIAVPVSTPPAPSQPTMADAKQVMQYEDQGRDKFKEVKTNPLKLAKDEPVSTFSIDVDTASYSFVRGSLNQNVLPQKNAVRVEELINYFPYDYSAPTNKEEPFKANVSVYPTPWNKDTKLLHIGIKGYQLDAKAKPPANLVFLIDTSGSMNEPNKLPLVQNSLKMLLDTLGEDDSVAIVTYAGNAGVALQPTKIKEKSKISAVIDNLGAGGSTAGAEGIRQAYQLAEQNLNKKGINRVILATDGDFNVGITDTNELKSFIERKRETGVTLSVLGFGTGNYNDEMMQTLAQNGNGNAAYIDTLNEARKALVEEAGSTLFTIAKDVKIQVEFNPEQVAEYRLIGYETRLLNREDFNNDKVDAGDIGSGHTVTALYEITPVASKAQLVDELRYKKSADKPTASKSGEYAFVKIRYKLPDGDTSKLITTPVNAEIERKTIDSIPVESRFATAVAAFGQLLRADPYLKDFDYDKIITLAENAKGTDKFGYRAEFINLVRMAKNAPALPVLK
jgi:Ca-activated chloride channel family protein